MRHQPDTAEQLCDTLNQALPTTKWAVANGDVSYVLKCASLLKVPDVGPVRVTLGYNQRTDELEYTASHDRSAATVRYIDDGAVLYTGVQVSLDDLVERVRSAITDLGPNPLFGTHAGDDHRRLTMSLTVLRHLRAQT
jgi:hypothetical protein